MRQTIVLIRAAPVLIACPSPAQTVNLWPGVAPGSEGWTQKEISLADTPLGTVVLNVVTPTLTAYLPVRAKALPSGSSRYVVLALYFSLGHHWLEDGVVLTISRKRMDDEKPDEDPLAAGEWIQYIDLWPAKTCSGLDRFVSQPPRAQ